MRGDIAFCIGTGPVAATIRFAQRIRYRHHPAQPWRFTHCAILVTEGDVVEATAHRGVIRSHLADKTEPVVVVDTRLSDADRDRAAQWAEKRIGTRYGMVGCLTVGLALITGGTVAVTNDRTWYCSELAAEALCHAGTDFDRDSQSMSPADLYVALEERTNG